MESVAWVLGLRAGHSVAVGELELVHVLPDRPELFPVLKSPAHCDHVFLWQDNVLPVFDLSTWLGDESATGDSEHIGIVRYRRSRGEPVSYGSLLIEGPPRQVRVRDEQACELPPGATRWRDVAISCFEHGGQPTPVLDVARIFSRAL
ncbi:MAG: chemotaxis protein CheW [Gammaproteobacteria bacterium]|nr:chemotaxis protein CheW [Gammaproteobacteria bacterium]